MEKLAFSINEFCSIANISRSLFYKLLKEESAPKIIKIGRKTLITKASADKWFKDMEEAGNA